MKGAELTFKFLQLASYGRRAWCEITPVRSQNRIGSEANVILTMFGLLVSPVQMSIGISGSGVARATGRQDRPRGAAAAASAKQPP
jgi:hypothetical protein